MKIVTVIGARPQFIKASVVSNAISSSNDMEEILVHTGQHFDANMSQIFFEQMGIPKPDYELNISGLTHGAMTGRMIEKIENVLINERPDYVLVYGDTNSTLAGSIAASKLNIPIAHVEAGLRSFNNSMPEEINRIVTDRLSSILFCPTETAEVNLKNECFDSLDKIVINVGDVMQDAAMHYIELASAPNDVDENILNEDFILCTIHRAENTDNKVRLENIINALNEINNDVKVVLPLHPRTKKLIEEYGIKHHFNTIEPAGYLNMLYLINKSKLIMTDSGGLQKEAYFFGKPCVTLRDETEWVELIENGYNVLAGSDTDMIIDMYKKMIDKIIPETSSLYGEGDASKKIIDALRK